MADDPFMKELGYPGGAGASPKSQGSGSTSYEASSDDDSPNAADVGRGLAKSGAGTLVALPRLANAGVGLVSSRWRNKLGELAEQVPGVKSLEEFADSPNKNWAESAGYWGGEGLQLFGGGLVGEAAKGAEAASAATRGGKAAEEAGNVIDWNAARTRAPQKALPPPREVPFTPNTTSFANAERKMAAARGAEYAEGLQAERTTAAAARAREPVTSRLNLAPAEAPAAAPRGSGAWPYRGSLGRIAQAAGRGGVAGAITDPQHPGEGFVSGATLGGATPLAGLAMRSGLGQWMAGHGARSAAASTAMAMGRALGIPADWLWGMSVPQLMRFWHSPFARRLDAMARSGARRGGSTLARVEGRGPGALGGVGAGAIDPGQTGPAYEPVPEGDQQ
jgi:hypothetical protein